MANPDHIAQLMKGVASWNAWRDENPIRADLSGPYLAEADLGEVDLSRANLLKANLTGISIRLVRFALGREAQVIHPPFDSLTVCPETSR